MSNVSSGETKKPLLCSFCFKNSDALVHDKDAVDCLRETDGLDEQLSRMVGHHYEVKVDGESHIPYH